MAEALRGPGRRVTVTTHRKPDGDAAGSMIGLARILRALGHDVLMWHVEGPGLPDQLAWLLQPGEEVAGGPVADHAQRLLVSVDAATSHRVSDDDPTLLGSPILNIDHHHDNPLWGDLNLVDGGASSTAEMVVRLADALGVAIDGDIALPLYVGLVTDTGRFSYANTGPGAHLAAARLVDAGVETLVRCDQPRELGLLGPPHDVLEGAAHAGWCMGRRGKTTGGGRSSSAGAEAERERQRQRGKRDRGGAENGRERERVIKRGWCLGWGAASVEATSCMAGLLAGGCR
ncbi:MAG: DHH family phosphoesterase, partial [Thermoleophilia bacterium]|nr:DHH family phosphoesterase [Thermoleophilia bacterium]